MKRLTNDRARRGVLLLVVLSLLVLFALIGVTFVLVAGQARRGARSDARNEQYGDDFRKQLDEGLAQLVRDTNNPLSTVRFHSLLNDMYGTDGIKGNYSAIAATTGTGGQMLDITAASWANLPGSASPNLSVSPSPVMSPGFFNGCVLTIPRPRGAVSTRIVGWSATGTTGPATIRVMAFDGLTVGDFSSSGTFLINGRPFNGTGAGLLDATTSTNFNDPSDLTNPLNPNRFTLLDAKDADGNFFALLPNFKFSLANLPAPLPGMAGGLDEDYEAADPQNMALAYSSTNPTASDQQILPSFHRPDLIRYYEQKLGVAWRTTMDPNLRRKIMLRPVGVASDHPNFTGSNPTFDAVNGPWDVDNDGDGIADSVWIDIGLPVQTAPDGRRFKPLLAYYVRDLDGRLNVNAHGSLAHVDPNFRKISDPTLLPEYFAGIPVGGPMANVENVLSPGQGYGVSEVNLTALFVANRTAHAALLASRYAQSGGASLPGVPLLDDPLSALKQFDFTPTASPTTLSAYGSPADLRGQGMIGLDVRGAPIMANMGNPTDTIDDPYELNLSRKSVRPATSRTAPPAALSAADNPFTPAELEQVLRYYDVDAAALPSGLQTLLVSGGVAIPTARNMVTTDSFDLPSPGIVPTRDMYAAASAMDLPAVSMHITDLLKTRLQETRLLVVPPLASYSELELKRQIQLMLPPELVAGQRMDVNRPFGNGRDDSPANTPGSGVVDEPGEVELGEETSLWPGATALPSGFSSVLETSSTWINGVDADGVGGVTIADAKLSRQLYARHLYILMMMLLDQPKDGNTPTPKAKLAPYSDARWGLAIDNEGPDFAAERARAVAQWAVNVVDFRDRDSIMTGFEYNVHPFVTGWTVDGDLVTDEGPERGVVWGCERPELLMTETLALHERRTEDLSSEAVEDGQGADTASGTLGGSAPNKDRDLDQRLMPRGSLFVELYNPWATPEPRPGELYDATKQGVQLNRSAPDGSPVWRLIVVRGNSMKSDPDSIGPTKTAPFAFTDIERSIYFVQPGNRIKNAGHGQTYYSDNNTYPVAPLPPGQYAVVGPGMEYTGTSGYVTPIGRRSGATGAALDIPNTRRITLAPAATASATGVVVDSNANSEPLTADIMPQVAVVVNNTTDDPTNTHRMSISEPNGIAEPYYPAFTAAEKSGDSGEGAYTQVKDIPLDWKRGETIAEWQVLRTGGKVDFRTIHLQRLADPTRAWNPQKTLPDGTTPDPNFNPALPVNPYLTIDTTSVDLVVFNGVIGTDPDPRDRSATGTANGLSTVQRGDADVRTAPPLNRVPNNLWRRQFEHASFPAGVPDAGGTHSFKFKLAHSLGYLNQGYGTAFKASDAPGGATSPYRGSPKQQPFPWLAWNNRPFAGPFELLLVPRSRSSRLLFDYSPSPNYPATAADFGGFPEQAIGKPSTGHLFNFFWTVPSTQNTGIAPQLSRIFEFLHVPSRFVGTATDLNPLMSLPSDERDLVSLFHPPFNFVSNYREPGRININTIPADNPNEGPSAIWQLGVRGNAALPAKFNFSDVSAARRGSAQPPTTVFGTSPTLFGNPFRSAAGATYRVPDSINLVTNSKADVTATMLRPSRGEIAPGSQEPLFAFSVPAVGVNPTYTLMDPNRNPTFRLQHLQKFGNLLTTRSNVYAVWITVGYFEVTPNLGTGVIDAAHPDGYQLGQELGADTGDVKRHRAFYMYDRTIPVGFEPGRDHNIEKGLLLKRVIE